MIVSFMSFSAVVSPIQVSAASRDDSCHKSGGFLGLPTWYEYLDVGAKGNDPCAIVGPTETTPDGKVEFSMQKALPRIILAIIDILLRVAGIVAVGYMIFGGIKYTLSQGEASEVEKAKNTVLNALIGLVVAVLATTIVMFIGGRL